MTPAPLDSPTAAPDDFAQASSETATSQGVKSAYIIGFAVVAVILVAAAVIVLFIVSRRRRPSQ
jgi:hypothetical protein